MGKIGALALVLGLGGTMVDAESPPAARRTLRLVRMADDPAQATLFLPLRDHLAQALRPQGFSDVEIRIVGQKTGVARAFLHGQVDVLITTPAKAEMLRRRSQARTLMLAADRGADGRPEETYTSVVFVRRDSGIGGAKELAGKRIAFEDESSTVAFHLPLCALRRDGLSLKRLESFQEGVPGGQAGYVFASAKFNLVSWVFHRKVEAGAVGLRTWRRLVESTPAFREQLRVISEGDALPRTMLVFRPGLSPEVEEALVAELETLAGSPGGRAALEPLGWAGLRRLKTPEAQKMSSLFRECGLTDGWR